MTVDDFSFFQTFVTAIVWSTNLFIFICNCEIDGIYKKNDLDFSCSDKMESELSYHDFDESCESVWSIYIYIFDAWIISISGQKRSIVICIPRMELYLRTGITGHPVELSFNSCFSRSRKWTGKTATSVKSMPLSTVFNSVRIFIKSLYSSFISHLVESM